ncbi:tetratricopeptide repeat protein [Clostridium botulinum]|uniref:Tetratricopeptide repeat protein n=1 Tax=Clostridium botulinum TaxID=1491 RepID=A0A9Q1UXW7_CLOBO|nr:tetratricopeptide repeat protein [Clostridium botulinum]KEI03032.1 hypothetical protein Y848_06140 [Clostridium botulinum C/D str. Sp77]KOA74499.1 hypothetical protein ADU77_12035 [Clostridium botulinum]KOA84816.1 hypothetical protein ADU80_09055 [Clostridium botulinum]KOA86039.1 hypothetical protein ADU74_09190 [Clostridium botulinum]KOA86474.1 hypothetical protein ADU75_05965 [Clostridium botulinum]
MIKCSIKNNLIYIFISLCLIFSVACSNKDSNSHDSATTKKNTSNLNTNTCDNSSIDLHKQYEVAYTLFFNHKYEEAIEICNNIIKKDNNFYKAYTTKGISLCFLNDFENGLSNINKSLDINPNFGYGRFNKALAYELYGHYDEALIWYDKALEIEHYTWSYYGKASIYGRLGNVQNTIKYLKIAINMNSNVKECIKTERDFDPIRDTEEFKKLLN